MASDNDKCQLVAQGLLPLQSVAPRLGLPLLDSSPAVVTPVAGAQSPDATVVSSTTPTGTFTPEQPRRAFDLRVARWSISLRGEYLVLGTERRYALLRVDHHWRRNSYTSHGTSKGEVSVVSYGPEILDESITASHCLPFYVPLSGRKSPVGVDTADVVVAVGYSNGGFRVFSREGHLLISQRLHSMPLVKIKFRAANKPTGQGSLPSTNAGASGQHPRRHPLSGITEASRRFSLGQNPARPGEAESSSEHDDDDDELLLVFADGQVATIQGKSLWIAIRISFGEQRTRDPLTSDRLISGPLESLYGESGQGSGNASFSYRKFALGPDRQNIRDVISCGPTWQGRYHEPASALHELMANTNPTHMASFNPTLLNATARFVAVGSEPMLGLYVTNKATTPSYSMATIASKLASRVTSAVLSLARSYWKSGGDDTTATTTRPPDPRANQGRFLVYDHGAGDNDLEGTQGWSPPTTIPLVTQLVDPHRHITYIAMAPAAYKLAVMTDGFGRVMLLDTTHVEVVRMWKGLRDCQCGWVEVSADAEEARQTWPSRPVASIAERRTLSSNSLHPLGERPRTQSDKVYVQTVPSSPASPKDTLAPISQPTSRIVSPLGSPSLAGPGSRTTISGSSTASQRARSASVQAESSSLLSPNLTIRLRRNSHLHPQSPTSRRVLFLVLYTERRGLVEIYRMRHGEERVGAFQVGTGCMLLTTPTQSLGGSLVVDNGIVAKHVDDTKLSQTWLVNPAGMLFTVKIPQSCA
ncbi:hypothetical protein H4R34_003031 [Dimargaris verticillata]|uniref:Rab3-GAP regulatory subunit N-terminal domain-containing protein n=1 Tax=Dimargaris verticillata TaxID=2761393 RepID=A0A9W8B7N4_9FUNG|nr:hypothetical protein H4R34_003031 [Dimargaris verticillata]